MKWTFVVIYFDRGGWFQATYADYTDAVENDSRCLVEVEADNYDTAFAAAIVLASKHASIRSIVLWEGSHTSIRWLEARSSYMDGVLVEPVILEGIESGISV